MATPGLIPTPFGPSSNRRRVLIGEPAVKDGRPYLESRDPVASELVDAALALIEKMGPEERTAFLNRL